MPNSDTTGSGKQRRDDDYYVPEQGGQAAARPREPLPADLSDLLPWLARRLMGRYYSPRSARALLVSSGILLLGLAGWLSGVDGGLGAVSLGAIATATILANAIYHERRWRAGPIAWGGQPEPDDDRSRIALDDGQDDDPELPVPDDQSDPLGGGRE